MKPAAYLHLVVWPALSRAADVPAEEAALVRGPALLVGVVFERTARENAKSLYDALRKPLKDGRGRDWVAVPPRQIGNQRLRLEFVSSLERLLDDGTQLEERLEQAVASAVRRVDDGGHRR